VRLVQEDSDLAICLPSDIFAKIQKIEITIFDELKIRAHVFGLNVSIKEILSRGIYASVDTKPAASASARRIGVVEIDADSLGLVVFERSGVAFIPVFNQQVPCGLARDLRTTGRLYPEAIAGALANLRRFCAFAREIGVDHLAVLATAAVRDASDGEAFAAEVARQCSVPVSIIDGAEEARLCAAGVLAGIPDADGIVADLGGESIKLVRVSPVTEPNAQIGRGVSLPLGPLRLDVPGAGMNSLPATIEQALADVPLLREKSIKNFYLVGDAARAIARLHMEQTQYPLHIIHRYTLTRREAEGFLDIISRQSRKSLERITTISRKRLEVVPLAALVLRELIKIGGPQRVVFSALGLREGYSHGLVPAEDRETDPLIAAYMAVDRRQSRFRLDGDRLQEWTAPLFPGLSEAMRRLHRAVSWLSDMARSEHPDYRARQAFARSLTLPYASSSHSDRVFVATALHARYGGAAEDPVKEPTRYLLDDRSAQEARTLGLALRLAYTLCADKLDLLSEVRLSRTSDTLILNYSATSNLLRGEAVEHRLEALGRALVLPTRIIGP
jgi:exopolyphosphatase/guanosine-5'-triphosphate,3'-diphosphate pyrophosphatase